MFLAGAVKLTIAIPSSGDDFEVFEVDAANLHELIIVAECVGTKFIIKGMQTPLLDYCTDNIDNKDKFIEVMSVLLPQTYMLAPLYHYYRDNQHCVMLEIMKKAYIKALHLLYDDRLTRRE